MLETRVLPLAYGAIGLGILGLWAMLLGTDQVPELRTARVEISFHVAIESAMGLCALLTAAALARGWAHRRALALFTNGMLAYSVVNSAGYYAQAGDLGMVGMFALLLAFALSSSVRLAPRSGPAGG